MRISTIISTYGMERIDDTHQAIDSILGQMREGDELILSIDENEQLSANLSRKYGERIRIVISKSKGLSIARNLGVEAASGEIVAFIDDDAIAGAGWLDCIRASFQKNDKIGACTGLILPDWVEGRQTWFPSSLLWIVSCTYMPVKDGQYIETAIGTNMAYRKDVLEKAGGFNADLGAKQKWKKIDGKWVQKAGLAGEERDLAFKIAKLGYKIVYRKKMAVKHKVHPYRTVMKNLLYRSLSEGETKAYFGREYAEPENDALALEQKYLMGSLGAVFRERKPALQKFRGIATYFFVVGMVGCGYIAGRLSRGRAGK